MGELPEDIRQFIDYKFDADDIPSVFKWLDNPELTTPRVIRSLLFLSDGSLSLLEHCIGECLCDISSVLMAAEYISGVAEEPMRARDMGYPFPHRRNLGRDYRLKLGRPKSRSEVPVRIVVPPKRAGRTNVPEYHQHLVGRQFYLGEATYVVARNQNRADVVRCYRIVDAKMNAATLPLLFVLEHVAEHIELEMKL